jgi:uncharacterized protein (DUF1800 family)
MATKQSQRQIGHLLRRAGFGPSAIDLEAFSSLSYEAAVDRLIAGLDAPAPKDPPGFSAYAPGAIQATWLERMRGTTAPLAEKLALFWHGHFATSIRKVDDPDLMWRQMALFRTLGAGRFRDLVTAVSRDPAMIRWLDGNSNRKGNPNENYARELMELFTLGRGNYTERDVREAARSFTGWGAEVKGFAFRAEYHDAGSKTVLGETGAFDGADVVRVVTARPECARFLSRKLLAFFAVAEPSDSDVASTAAVFSKSDGDMKSTLRHVFLSTAFRSDAAYRALVKSPAELVVGAVRGAGLGAVPPWAVESMGRMGQTLFAPPTVEGWDGGRAWLASGALLERVKFASRLAAESGGTPSGGDIALAFDGAIPKALEPTIGSTPVAGRFALALASPEYQLN